MDTAKIPSAPRATEAELVADIAASVSLHGYKVIRHQVSVDHEKEETRLSVALLKGNPEQTVLQLREGGKKGKGPDDDDDEGAE